MTVQVIHGDCREVLKAMPDESVHCCVTSPPYWGLRDYGTADQIGLEATPDEFVSELVAVFREVRRVLRGDGTCWVNLGDCYATGAGKVGDCPAGGKQGERWRGTGSKHGSGIGPVTQPNRMPQEGLKPKDLVGIPWRVAFALQADGWYLRQDIIWNKPNPMPESVRDRCTKAHEYIFLLTKSARYWYDADAIKEVSNYPPGTRVDAVKGSFNSKWSSDAARVGDESFRAIRERRNRRSVWTVTTMPYKGAHFATFPPKLIEPCIMAGCPVGGTVLDPFAGSGTTGEVAERFGRHSVLIEASADYVTLIRERTSQRGLVMR